MLVLCLLLLRVAFVTVKDKCGISDLTLFKPLSLFNNWESHGKEWWDVLVTRGSANDARWMSHLKASSLWNWKHHGCRREGRGSLHSAGTSDPVVGVGTPQDSEQLVSLIGIATVHCMLHTYTKFGQKIRTGPAPNAEAAALCTVRSPSHLLPMLMQCCHHQIYDLSLSIRMSFWEREIMKTSATSRCSYMLSAQPVKVCERHRNCWSRSPSHWIWPWQRSRWESYLSMNFSWEPAVLRGSSSITPHPTSPRLARSAVVDCGCRGAMRGYGSTRIGREK